MTEQITHYVADDCQVDARDLRDRVRRSSVMSERLSFPDTPIDGRMRHAHHYHPEFGHGCTEHFHIQRHGERCYHHHDGTGHLISIDREAGIDRDAEGVPVRIAG